MAKKIQNKIAIFTLGAMLILAASPVCAANEMLPGNAPMGDAPVDINVAITHHCADADMATPASDSTVVSHDASSAAEPNCCLNEDHFHKAIGEPKNDVLEYLPISYPILLYAVNFGVSAISVLPAEAEESPPPAVPLETIVIRE